MAVHQLAHGTALGVPARPICLSCRPPTPPLCHAAGHTVAQLQRRIAFITLDSQGMPTDFYLDSANTPIVTEQQGIACGMPWMQWDGMGWRGLRVTCSNTYCVRVGNLTDSNLGHSLVCGKRRATVACPGAGCGVGRRDTRSVHQPVVLGLLGLCDTTFGLQPSTAG
ncbi:hypothetical protein LY78DRAFT_656478 [Colletotrichum sublineola]|nr:hypothetical protein LY78DRAFT_656478 [Colletotrichum sublineola]